MYCRHCGQEIKDGDLYCTRCGKAVDQQPHYCQNCGAKLDGFVQECPVCGYRVQSQAPTQGKSKVVVGLLAIFLGELGIHNFYMGYSSKGLAQLLLCVCGVFTCGLTSLAAAIWGLVDAIYVFTGKINCDANGEPLV